MPGYVTPKRYHRSLRLKGYDYSQGGAYFITICTQAKKLYCELYPELKHIVQAEWESLLDRFPHIILDAFVIMPNHIHAIIIVETPLASVPSKAGASPAATLGDVVGAFKSLCANMWLRHIRQNNINALGTFWQKNYYEHIIRSEKELNQVREYIINNPLKWEFDHENPNHIVDLTYLAGLEWLEERW